jgi:cytochrome c oxidase subunit IV
MFMYDKQILGMRACTWVYTFLIGFSFVTYLIGKFDLNGLTTAITVLALALLKGHLVGLYFMGLVRVKGFWHWPISVWIVLTGSLTSIAFYLSYQ